MEDNLNRIYGTQMTDSEFNQLSSFIYQEYGIKMPPAKKVMLQSRLQKRLRELNILTFRDYIKFLFSDKGQSDELIHMIDVVSTNKTDFFREPSHFEFMKNDLLPEWHTHKMIRYPMKIWSAGCSSGEEPYTMAIVLSEFQLHNPGFDFSIWGSDISSRMLFKAADAIYADERIIGIPLDIKKRYFLKSKDPNVKTVRIIPQLRSKVNFCRLNFMDNYYEIQETFDIVFCRNVLIYFDRQTQEKVIAKLCSKLRVGGIFFLGHSESILNMNLPLQQIKPTIFKRI